eukprot:gnl/Chilomastix_cuspidata/5591.p1 GENE.gnl/Chilomastix_cuspidata/5591~~gnl/Chilomastix_cuspidata/5591.p1  ORF type:complete len:2281 (+),score=275.26 gnl/Chilomastix_cuspidata/5591:480-6845(+)
MKIFFSFADLGKDISAPQSVFFKGELEISSTEIEPFSVCVSFTLLVTPLLVTVQSSVPLQFSRSNHREPLTLRHNVSKLTLNHTFPNIFPPSQFSYALRSYDGNFLLSPRVRLHGSLVTLSFPSVEEDTLCSGILEIFLGTRIIYSVRLNLTASRKRSSIVIASTDGNEKIINSNIKNNIKILVFNMGLDDLSCTPKSNREDIFDPPQIDLPHGEGMTLLMKKKTNIDSYVTIGNTNIYVTYNKPQYKKLNRYYNAIVFNNSQIPTKVLVYEKNVSPCAATISLKTYKYERFYFSSEKSVCIITDSEVLSGSVRHPKDFSNKGVRVFDSFTSSVELCDDPSESDFITSIPLFTKDWEALPMNRFLSNDNFFPGLKYRDQKIIQEALGKKDFSIFYSMVYIFTNLFERYILLTDEEKDEEEKFSDHLMKSITPRQNKKLKKEISFSNTFRQFMNKKLEQYNNYIQYIRDPMKNYSINRLVRSFMPLTALFTQTFLSSEHDGIDKCEELAMNIARCMLPSERRWSVSPYFSQRIKCKLSSDIREVLPFFDIISSVYGLVSKYEVLSLPEVDNLRVKYGLVKITPEIFFNKMKNQYEQKEKMFKSSKKAQFVRTFSIEGGELVPGVVDFGDLLDTLKTDTQNSVQFQMDPENRRKLVEEFNTNASVFIQRSRRSFQISDLFQVYQHLDFLLTQAQFTLLLLVAFSELDQETTISNIIDISRICSELSQLANETDLFKHKAQKLKISLHCLWGELKRVGIEPPTFISKIPQIQKQRLTDNVIKCRFMTKISPIEEWKCEQMIQMNMWNRRAINNKSSLNFFNFSASREPFSQFIPTSNRTKLPEAPARKISSRRLEAVANPVLHKEFPSIAKRSLEYFDDIPLNKLDDDDFGLCRNAAPQASYKIDPKTIQTSVMDSEAVRAAMKGKDATSRLGFILSNIERDTTPNGSLCRLFYDIMPIDAKSMKTDPINDNLMSGFKIQELQIINVLSAKLKSALIPIDSEKRLCPFTFKHTVISIHVDISASMDECKRKAAFLIAISIIECFLRVGSIVQLFAFGDRDAIWKLYSSFEESYEVGVARLLSALGSEKRFGSFPGDSVYTSARDFRNIHSPNLLTQHLCIVLSDMISYQILDPRFNWSENITNPVVFIKLESKFNTEKLAKSDDVDEIDSSLTRITSESLGLFKHISLNPTFLVNYKEKNELSAINLFSDHIVNYAIQKNNVGRPISRMVKVLSLKDTGQACPDLRMPSHSVSCPIKPFAQNYPLGSLSISTIKLHNPQVKLPKQIFKTASREANSNDGLIFGDMKVAQALYSNALQQVFVENKAGGKEPSQSSGTIWPSGFRRFIVSGGMYRYIFLKRSQKNQKEYSVSLVLDIAHVSSDTSDIFHLFKMLSVLFNALLCIPGNEDITLDLLLSNGENVFIIYNSLPISQLMLTPILCSSIFTLAQRSTSSSGLGTACQAALKLQNTHGGASLGRLIFVLTNSVIEDAHEIRLHADFLNNANAQDVDVVGIGYGLYAPHLDKLFPQACFSPDVRDFPISLAHVFGIASSEVSPKVNFINILPDPDPLFDEQLAQALERGPYLCPELSRSVNEKNLHSDFYRSIYNTVDDGSGDLVFAEHDPYKDNSAAGNRILIVMLYQGGYRNPDGSIADREIVEDVFRQHTGRTLQSKGFEFDIVFSYKTTVEVLRQLDLEGHCQYTQLWLFCTNGQKELPDVAPDKDFTMFISFMEHIAAFWQQGGSLLLWTDNEPYTFEVNYLLENYLRFPSSSGLKASRVRFARNYFGDKTIVAGDADAPLSGTFMPSKSLPLPGKAPKRASLAIGLTSFYEGKTIASAVDDAGADLLTEDELWPFKPFAFTSEALGANPRATILYYDPKISEKYFFGNCGPIIIHGGSTSAFIGYKEESTGCLIVSMSCWLARVEERLYLSSISDDFIPMRFRAEFPEPAPREFLGWAKARPVTAPTNHILLLDASGSLGPYGRMVRGAANELMRCLQGTGHAVCVIKFGSNAQFIYEGAPRPLTTTEYPDNPNGGTSFTPPFVEAQRHLSSRMRNHVIFFTDGRASDFPGSICTDFVARGVTISVCAFGGIDESMLKRFLTPDGKYLVGRSMTEFQTDTFTRVVQT